ncbi:acylneuraminate cytidylyltransferase family protein [Paenibacillus sp. PR3]|uniref:Acylneuraminate cytidylyltransferase family protein n=1 Tax=Paenibacillus terricola TaxID=2763503 RepID=A0ABR8MZH9_9BACL|nr:acylneuraminate cytidylyltransferase family protein [Paenibacillus terricola]MBD3920701.1 acylneuraminate cytidylyltransferase family protein [Paenibacillus terricola]
MIQGKKVLGIIPARGGSKGVPMKNTRLFNGKPLIAWAIEAAKRSRYLDRVIVSSDNEDIMRIAREWDGDVPEARPEELARDDSTSIDVVLHLLDQFPGYDYVVLLQPTSPFRTTADIDGCIQMCLTTGAPAAVSVTEPEQSPYWMFKLNSAGRLDPLVQRESTVLRRQDLPTVYSLNGAVYVASVEWFQQSKAFVTDQTVGYVMDQDRSLDIDTEQDFIVGEALIGLCK